MRLVKGETVQKTEGWEPFFASPTLNLKIGSILV
jgi:hypothetical protein